MNNDFDMLFSSYFETVDESIDDLLSAFRREFELFMKDFINEHEKEVREFK